MKDTDMIRSAIQDISRLTLTGPVNWELAAEAIKKLYAVLQGLQKAGDEKARAEAAALEKARQARQAQLQAAAEAGEEVVGGQVIHIGPDGTEELVEE